MRPCRPPRWRPASDRCRPARSRTAAPPRSRCSSAPGGIWLVGWLSSSERSAPRPPSSAAPFGGAGRQLLGDEHQAQREDHQRQPDQAEGGEGREHRRDGHRGDQPAEGQLGQPAAGRVRPPLEPAVAHHLVVERVLHAADRLVHPAGQLGDLDTRALRRDPVQQLALERPEPVGPPFTRAQLPVGRGRTRPRGAAR